MMDKIAWFQQQLPTLEVAIQSLDQTMYADTIKQRALAQDVVDRNSKACAATVSPSIEAYQTLSRYIISGLCSECFVPPVLLHQPSWPLPVLPFLVHPIWLHRPRSRSPFHTFYKQAG